MARKIVKGTVVVQRMLCAGKHGRSYGQVGSVTGRQRRTVWLMAAATVSVLALILSACSSNVAPPAQQVITDKGDPFSNLLVPKLQASVTDGAVGVEVDSPVTVSAGDGVLGAVSMINEEGAPVAGQLSADGLTWSTAEPLGYNKQYTLHAEALGLGGVARNRMTFETRSPENLTMPYVLPNDGEVVGIGQPIAIRFDENIPDRVAAQRASHQRHDQPSSGGSVLLAEQPRSTLAPTALLEARYHRGGTGQDVRRRPR
jgi:hypothetical protein